MRRTVLWPHSDTKASEHQRPTLHVLSVEKRSDTVAGSASDRLLLYPLDKRPDMTVLSIDTRPASPAEASALGLRPQTAVHVIDGLNVMKGVPVALCQSVCPADLFPDLPALMAEGVPLDKALRHHGIERFRGETRVTAVRATAVHVLHLGVEEGGPVLCSAFTNIDIGGLAIEYGQIWFAGDRAAVVATPE
ncbi:GntR family transcriptional regulator [Falsirhodobacter sp. 1013]|uniref:GntR family transcriptional regulator n=1 Tax=Falsirhodobacter sp. 1013 TaxID=3417566 RepID=UPI003EBFC978